MSLIKRKWLEYSFYKQRPQRVKIRRIREQKKKAAYAIGDERWNGLSTKEDWIKGFLGSTYLPKNNVRLNLIPKTGGTTLKLALLKLHYYDNIPNELINYDMKKIYGVFEKLAPEWGHNQQTRIKNIVNAKAISFTCNPYHRLISCYRNQIAPYDFRGNPQKTHTQKQVPTSVIESFEDFSTFACNQPNHLRDPHFKSQWLLLSPGISPIFFLGTREHFSDHARSLLLELNTPSDLLEETLNKKMNHTGKYNWKDYYNQELADLVYQAYWPDFEAFGYHKDSWKKDFKETYKELIRDYDPAQDIERFRAWFPCTEKESVD